MENKEEKELVELAKKDSRIFDKLFEIYYPKILRYAIFRTGNAEVGRDIASETFYKAMKNLWKFRWMGTTFSAWLYRITGNLVIDYFRGRKTEAVFMKNVLKQMKTERPLKIRDIENEITETQEELERNRDYAEIKECLFKLPMLYQEVLVLRYIEGHKIREICRILNKKEGTVKSLISRGIVLLKQIMQPSVGMSVKNVKVNGSKRR
ncbi:MAG: RNA polymerase sigma factor [Candidatus Goldbacteria bacterium]|nr:RNA polymerase sigma factor [Candidatus Goldiibacteriota bacterium]